MQRKNIHLTDSQISGLDILSNSSGLPVAELVRRAVDGYLEEMRNARFQMLPTLKRGAAAHKKVKAK